MMQQFNEAADATAVDIPIGEVFEICLTENPTTGFRWNLESRGEPACILVSEYFSRHGDAPGSQGVHHWNFNAVAPGTSTIELAYRRQWQKGPPARTFTLGIRAGG
jgi:inhibitor of cysteine peptidase